MLIRQLGMLELSVKTLSCFVGMKTFTVIFALVISLFFFQNQNKFVFRALRFLSLIYVFVSTSCEDQETLFFKI